MLPEAHLGVLPPIPAGSGRAATRTASSPCLGSVPATGIEDLSDPIRKWPFNDPGSELVPGVESCGWWFRWQRPRIG